MAIKFEDIRAETRKKVLPSEPSQAPASAAEPGHGSATAKLTPAEKPKRRSR